MARAFRMRGRGDGRRFAATLDAAERRLLVDLLLSTRALLDPPETTGGDPFADLVAGLSLGGSDDGMPVGPSVPEDPAVARLLPTGARGDDDAAAEFRRLTEAGLRVRKGATLAAAAELLRRDTDEVALDAVEARTLAMALTDVRLVVADRIGIVDDDTHDELERLVASGEVSEELEAAVSLYDFLGWLQDSLTTVLLKALPR